MQAKTFQKRILDYYTAYGRKHLPWQQNKNHYRVWVSEIMLQQTQVTTVIPYYERFMQRFSSLEALASAELDEVLALWTGLGYYSRARNLHKCAQVLITEFNGQWPNSVATLETLPGIGRSTAGAIHSLATGQSAAILDGNVKRVLCRFYAIEGWPGKPAVQKQLWQLAESLTPAKKADQFNQAMMDLGATLCKRSRPDCDICPLQSHCQAYADNRVNEFPNPKPKTTKPERHAIFIIARCGHEVLLEKRPSQGIWGGLWCLPEAPLDTNDRDLAAAIATPIACESVCALPSFRHTFSHYHLHIHPRLLSVAQKPNAVMDSDRWQWQDRRRLDELGMPSPIVQLLKNLE
ncbi:MAG: A/G-specific adenine glycosylase [Gammaproteobacteria bacterium]|nr:A/G-specific adenine glycosylase [Gammaproteobacteria bacterium]